MQAITITISTEMLKWVDEKARQLKLDRSKVIRQCIQEQMKLDEAKKKGVDVVIPGCTPLHIDEKTYMLLEEIADIANIDNLNELLEYIITGMHVMLKLGVWKLLKPLPELAKTVMQETEQNQV
jgi:metal-responsive CopG/Arc/MetJ family transcriptional regulator